MELDGSLEGQIYTVINRGWGQIRGTGGQWTQILRDSLDQDNGRKTGNSSLNSCSGFRHTSSAALGDCTRGTLKCYF